MRNTDMLTALLAKEKGGPVAPAPSSAGMGGVGNPSTARSLAGILNMNTAGGAGANNQVGSGLGSISVANPQNFTPANPANTAHPGIISRIFDVLSRPEYAEASALKDAAIDPGRDPVTGGALITPQGKLSHTIHFDAGGILKGLSQGIEGKSKNTFVTDLNDPASPLMEQKNRQGKVIEKAAPGGALTRTLGGIVEGLALDPTSYLSLGLSNFSDATKGSEEINAALKAEEATKAAETVKDAGAAAKLVSAANTGVNAAGAVSDVGKAKTIAGAVVKAGRTVAPATSKLKDVHNAAKIPVDSKALVLKFAGKPIVTSTKAYKAGRIITDPVRYSGLAQTAATTLKAGHGLPEGVHNLQRIFAGVGRQNTVDKAKEVLGAVKGISKSDDQAIFKAIQEGTTHTLPTELQGPADYFKSELEALKAGSTPAKDAFGATTRGVDASKASRLFEDAPKVEDTAAKFDEGAAPFKGAKPYDRATQAFISQYDKAMRSQSYDNFLQEISRRFPEDAKLDEVKTALKKSKEVFGVQGENSARWQHYIDQAQAPWKRWVTAYRPGFQVKHMLGDLFNANLAGTDPERFYDAAKVIGKDTKAVDDTAKTISIAGSRISPAEADRLYRSVGLSSGFIDTELAGKANRGIAHAVTEFSSAREKYTRMATFLSALDKEASKGGTMANAAEKASAVVRKYHFDYADLTPAERSIRRFVPFYTYTKNELPLLLEHTLTNPHKITDIGRMGVLAQQLLGVQPDPNNPYPGLDNVMPSWLSGKQVLGAGNNAEITPSTPVDHLSWLDPSQAVKQAEGMVTPLIKAPIELATGKTIPDGIPIRKAGTKGSKWDAGTSGQSNTDSTARYLSSYLPYGSFASTSNSSNAERLMSILTGASEHHVKSGTKPDRWGG